MGRKRGRKEYCPPIYKRQKVARVTNNGYLNFMTEYKKRFYGLSPQDMVHYAAKQWTQLSMAEKEAFKSKSPAQYVACEMKSDVAGGQQSSCQRQSPSARLRESERRSSRSKTLCRSAKNRQRGKPKPQQSKRRLSHMGSAVAYIHFLRKFQRKNTELRTIDLLKTATRLWCRLPERHRHAFERPLWIVTIGKS
uniref:Isoform C of Protamine-like protein 99C n=1 Tax=Drosophila melanogaster TaxID=7227 RepID=Q9VAF7-2|nr:Protamine-like 99C, isoform C [Drosophila melanogaster]ACZ95065.1 Protamine-like 99C, isoform C [Drosophila melanogaster]|eukprot:NP_001163771.1 Protamine-like 99C, isoform C [Drosophila melanogaster]